MSFIKEKKLQRKKYDFNSRKEMKKLFWMLSWEPQGAPRQPEGVARQRTGEQVDDDDDEEDDDGMMMMVLMMLMMSTDEYGWATDE